MTDIEEYSDFLPDGLRGVWPHVAECAQKVGGVLMGGTAVAIHLRHRESEDLDVMTLREFSGNAIKNSLVKSGAAVEVIEVAKNMFHGFVDTVKVDVFRALESNGVEPSSMRWIAPTTTVSDMQVGSLPDLMAAKLDVIWNRAKLRDYIDLAALDRSGACSLESGLGYYCRKYGYEYPPRVLEQIIGLLDSPERCPPTRPSMKSEPNRWNTSKAECPPCGSVSQRCATFPSRLVHALELWSPGLATRISAPLEERRRPVESQERQSRQCQIQDSPSTQGQRQRQHRPHSSHRHDLICVRTQEIR